MKSMAIQVWFRGCVEGCGIVGDDVESVLSLIVYYSCNYQKSCAVS